MWYDVLWDAFLDTLKLFPFLFVLYILIELMEHNTALGRPHSALSRRWGPALGATLGLVPMCGFSVMAAKLYQHRHITVGTLVAVFTATSDEALLVLLLEPTLAWDAKLFTVLGLLAGKLVLGIAAGYVLDLLVKGKPAPLPEHREHAHGEEHGHGLAHDEEHEHGEDHEHGGCACDELSACEHKKESKVTLYLVSPLLHALQVAAFVFAVNLAFGFLFFGLGEENVVGFMRGAGYWLQPLVCVLVGAIPNCASSVVLAEVYALGGIGFGGLFAGLIVNAGIGYPVLFKRGMGKRGLFILLGMAVFAIAAGYAASALSLLF